MYGNNKKCQIMTKKLILLTLFTKLSVLPEDGTLRAETCRSVYCE